MRVIIFLKKSLISSRNKLNDFTLHTSVCGAYAFLANTQY